MYFLFLIWSFFQDSKHENVPGLVNVLWRDGITAVNRRAIVVVNVVVVVMPKTLIVNVSVKIATAETETEKGIETGNVSVVVAVVREIGRNGNVIEKRETGARRKNGNQKLLRLRRSPLMVSDLLFFLTAISFQTDVRTIHLFFQKSC
jgi:hypothetical protein